MSKKQEFINWVEEIIEIAKVDEIPENVKMYWEAFKGNSDSEKPLFTDNGKLILRFLQEHQETTMWKAREIGESRWTLSKKVKLVLDSMMSFSYFPVRFMSGMGVTFAAVAVIWAIVLIIQKLTGVEDAVGWTSMMVLMLFGFGVIMVMLGLLGEYIWRALDAARNRPPFLIDETKGFEEKM